MSFGLLNEGFVKKRLADIKTEIEESLRSSLGNQINLLPSSTFSQIVGIFAEREALIWELAEDVYNSSYPDTAFGTSLDNVLAITGLTRQGAQPSTLLGYRLFGTVGSVIPVGTQFQVQGVPSAIFATTAEVTLASGQDARDLLTFDAVPDAGTFRLNFRNQDTPDFPFNVTAATIEAALNALDFGTGIEVTGDFTVGFTIAYTGDAGLQEQSVIGIDDNQLSALTVPVNITAAQTQLGINQATVDLEATVDGPTQGQAGTINVIVNPVSGLDRGLNVQDAIIGRDVETDNEARARRAQTLQAAGAGTPEAIEARLRDLTGVTDAFVFENQTLIADTDGRPPKSFEAVVNGGLEQDIIDLLWLVKPAGIATFGQITGTATDSQGQPQTISFSRPTQLDIFVEVDLTVDPNTFPSNGLASARDAIVDRGNQFGIGGDVIVIPTLICALDNIPGILDIDIRIGTSPSPTSDANIPVAVNEVPVFDSSRTTVVAI